jgi:hypothetical protein
MPPTNGDLASLEGMGNRLNPRTMFLQDVSSRFPLTAYRSPLTFLDVHTQELHHVANGME